MDKDFYTNIGYAFVWCIKYIFIPTGVAIFGRLLSEKLLPPIKKQRKKRLVKNRLNKVPIINRTVTSVTVLIYIISLIFEV